MSARIFDVITAEAAEHENSTTEGAFASTTFPADFWQVGKVVRFHGAVTVNDSNSTDTLTGRIRFGSSTTVTSNTEVVATGAVDVADNDAIVVDGLITCRVGGSAGELVFSGSICDPDALGQAMVSFYAAQTAIDMTAATYLNLTGDWSVAHADNEAAAAVWAVAELTG